MDEDGIGSSFQQATVAGVVHEVVPVVVNDLTKKKHAKSPMPASVTMVNTYYQN